ncbi:DUF6764 family protein [Nocardia higoensis]|uniref:DUF6764 family protein n=1 Tax=Nocardia higoensis TaxID=228599 RepID=UPI0002EACC4A|nr:DUF6764 family protein [Nocardia higoensis]
MKVIGAIVCSAAVGAVVVLPGVASAAPVHCVAEREVDDTVVEGGAGCRAAVDEAGHARSFGLGGVGYARAEHGADALGIGIAGGVGASEGRGGVPLAFGLGRDAMAVSNAVDEDAGDGASRTLAVAFEGSFAEVTAGAGQSVVCLGAGAFAWDERSGAACLATPFGVWTQQPQRPSASFAPS